MWSRLEVFCSLPRVALGIAPALVVATLGCGENAESPTAPESSPAPLAAATAPPRFLQVTAGGWHTCGAATDNQAYCWGLNEYGQLGTGSRVNRSRPTPVARP